MSLTSTACLLVVHGLFDWLLQDRDTAKKKSSSLKHLAGHLLILYHGLLIWAAVCSDLFGAQILIFALSNTILHGIIDWNIWKLYKLSVARRFPNATIQFQYWEDSWFYNFIMGDQLLHGLCYLGTYYLIKLGGTP